jgi:periplasmic protein CpxP/Spy
MLKTLLTVLAVPALAGTAIAADSPPPPAHGGWNREAFEQMRAQHEKARADDMAMLIGLRPDQRPALDGFLATMHPQRPDRMGGGQDGKPGDDAGTLARLDSMSAHIDRRDAEAKRRIDATRSFYTSLTPDQQKRFDALARLGHEHGFGGHGFHRGGGDHGRGPGGGGAPQRG